METPEKDTPEVEPQETTETPEKPSDADVVSMGDLDLAPEGGEETGEPTPKPEKFQPKHTSWEETEKARVELEKQFHTARSDISKVQKELDRYKNVLKGLKEPTQLREKQSIEQQIINKAIEDIKRIPQDDPDAEQKANEIWARSQRDIANAIYEERANQDRFVNQQMAVAEKKFKDSGLSLMVDIDGTEQDLGEAAFWLAAKSPNMPKLDTIEEEVDWVIGEMRRYNQAIIDAHEAKKTGKPQKPLGRGGTVTTPKEEDKPSTMIDDFKELEEQRRKQR